jgi:hypothetical protein
MPDYEFTNPEHDDKKVAIFKDLQTLCGVDLVTPVGEDHMVLGRDELQIVQADAVWEALLAPGEA